MKHKNLLIVGALSLAVVAVGGALARPYLLPSDETTAAPVIKRRSPQSFQFSRASDSLLADSDAEGALKLALAWQKSHPDDAAGFATQARALAMNGDIDGAIACGARAESLDTHKVPRPWLDELRIVRRRFPKLQLFPLRARTAETDTEREYNALGAQARALLQAEKYDQIESIAAQLLSSRAQFRGGGWKLPAFALSLCEAPDYGEASWKSHNQMLLNWHARHPESKLATLMLARSWGEGAYSARGGEYAYKVKPKQWSGMNRRLQAAAPLFAASMSDIKRTPLMFSGLQQWALLGQVPRPVYETAWKQAEAAFPGYTPFYVDKALFLMPRWYGAPGEWEAFATNSADKIGGVKGDMLYATIVENQSENYDADFLHNSAVSWPRTKRGLKALIANSGDPVGAATLAQRLAAIAQDSPFARELFSGPLAHEFAPMSRAKHELAFLCRNRIHAFAT